jgi:beta-galactosidase
MITLEAGQEQRMTIRVDSSLTHDIERWSLTHPALYQLELKLFEEDREADWKRKRVGFREAVFRKDGFYLNGERIKLFGLNRHQTFPYIGGAAPARLQRKDADILKDELGCNIVRTSHYPQAVQFLNRCDEIGLLVFDEIPGWQWIGDSDWKALALRDLESMIIRDRNHPSVVLWGVRINESPDDEALYRATNELAHRLDPTRQTGGVRFFQSSQFLEDVFTYNDFSDGVEAPLNTPHLISEFGGHMFPTKSYDSEERQVEHALRHARIHDQQMGMADVTGAIGWCAFDYNTHREFGAGDRICHHGVMDIFRLPKFAACFYESQIAPTVRPVLRAATFWTFGERAGAGVDPLIVFSNCEAIEVYKGEELHGRYQPDHETYPHLAYPPFTVPGFDLNAVFGFNYRDLRIVGYLGGVPVIEQRISSDGLPFELTLEADDATLDATGADMTRLVFKLVDRFGNRQPYTTRVVSFTLEGPGELVGTNPFPLVGGQAAVYVRAGREPGEIKLRASVPGLDAAEVTIKVQ